MVRKVYERTVYTDRMNQMTRHVYDRANNVIPTSSGKYEVTEVSVNQGGTGYTVGDVLSLTGSEGDTAAKVSVTTVNETKGVTAISVTTKGASTTDPAGDSKTVTGGTGSGATLDITSIRLPHYEVATATVNNGGTGYAVNDIISIEADLTDAQVKVTTVGESGVVTAVELTEPGESTVDIAGTGKATTGGTGTGLTLDLTSTESSNSTYEVATATVNTAGTGYSVNDVLTLDLDQTDATFTVNSVSSTGAVTAVELTSAGAYAEDMSGNLETTGGTGTGCVIAATMEIDIDESGQDEDEPEEDVDTNEDGEV